MMEFGLSASMDPFLFSFEGKKFTQIYTTINYQLLNESLLFMNYFLLSQDTLSDKKIWSGKLG